MNYFKRFLSLAVVAGLLGVITTSATAQSNEKRRTAVQTFNKARKLAEDGKYDQSIKMYEEAMDDAQAAEKAGQKGEDIVKMTKKKLPSIYYRQAVDAYKAFQSSQSSSDLDKAISSFNDAVDAGKKYGNQSITDKSTSNITKMMYMKSLLQYNQKNYDQATTTIDKVIERNPNYAQAYYQKGLILKDQDGNFDKAITMFDKAISVAKKNNNSEIARKAQQSAAGQLIYRGSNLVENKKYTSGINMLNQALKYDPQSSDAEFRLAEAYNGKGSYGEALSHAQKALQNEKGGRQSKAKIYFQIGSAHEAQGKTAQACKDFANASYGQFQESAKHEMKYELKCDSN